MEKAGKIKKREPNPYEWFSDDADYFYCREVQNLGCALHFHSSWEFIFVAEGKRNFLLDGEEILAKAGEAVFYSRVCGALRRGRREESLFFSCVRLEL